MKPAPVIEVAAGLIFRAGRLLITRRPEGSHLAGLWEFPGGKLEPGESWEAALIRELQEELGVTVSVGRQLAEVGHAYPGKTVHLRFFVCALAHGEPRPVGCAAIAWVTAAELKNYAFPPADEQLLARLPGAPEFSGETL